MAATLKNNKGQETSMDAAAIYECVQTFQKEHRRLLQSRCDNPYIVQRLAEWRASPEGAKEVESDVEELHEFLVRSPPPQFPTHMSDLIETCELKPFLADPAAQTEEEKGVRKRKQREGGETLSDKDSFPTALKDGPTIEEGNYGLESQRTGI